MKTTNALALRPWAVHCDALARGEQIFLLCPEPGRASFSLVGEEFWLLPDWEAQRPADLIGPYRDRARKLDGLRHDDDRHRLKYYAVMDYRETVSEAHRLLRLDGEHPVNARAVEELASPSGTEVQLLLLRVHELPVAGLLDRTRPAPGDGPWVELERGLETEALRPVLDDETYLSEKARILQLTGSVQAV